jgi:E-phenylitaconyl-CoA hydratase
MTYKNLFYEKKDNYCIITLNRPDALNSMDLTLKEELISAFEDFKYDHSLRVAILTGVGNRAFCAGSDLKIMPSDDSFAVEYLNEDTHTHFIESLKCMKPIICAINGYAIGGGLELALACDIRIASDNASFGLSEVKVGSIPGAGGTQRLPRAIPQAIAMKMLLTGERIQAVEAYRVGLISDLVPLDELLATAEKIAQKISENGHLAVNAVKKLVIDGQNMSLDDGIQVERLMFGLLKNTVDRIEGRKAFSEKRKPIYKGK